MSAATFREVRYATNGIQPNARFTSHGKRAAASVNDGSFSAGVWRCEQFG